MQNPTKTQKYDTIQEQNINGFRAEITCNNSRDCNILCKQMNHNYWRITKNIVQTSTYNSVVLCSFERKTFKKFCLKALP